MQSVQIISQASTDNAFRALDDNIRAGVAAVEQSRAFARKRDVSALTRKRRLNIIIRNFKLYVHHLIINSASVTYPTVKRL